jgi:class 3 adenylate cyclase
VDIGDVSRLVGVPVDSLYRWRELGLLGSEDDLGNEDIQRARLVAFAERRGIAAEDVARISTTAGDMLADFVRWSIRPEREAVVALDEAAERVGVDPDVLEKMRTAAGLRDQEWAYEEDVEALRLAATALKFGLPLEALLQILRVLNDSLGKVAETMTRVFHLYVHERFRAEGLTGSELSAATQALADPMNELVEPGVMYFFRAGWERANREDLILHLLEETTPPSDVPGEFVRTVLFVDLSGFTPLTETVGDEAAARMVERFSDSVRDCALAADGQIVKQIGDEFMLVFPHPVRAIAFGVAIRSVLRQDPSFPAVRIGAHAGSVLYREGDYLGANVNLAARVTSAAQSDEFVVTRSIVEGAPESNARFVALGERNLKGVAEPVALFRVEPSRPS